MIVEQVRLTTDWVGPAVRTKVYTTRVDDRGKTYVDYTQYLYVPYSNRGQEVVENRKGQSVDLKA